MDESCAGAEGQGACKLTLRQNGMVAGAPGGDGRTEWETASDSESHALLAALAGRRGSACTSAHNDVGVTTVTSVVEEDRSFVGAGRSGLRRRMRCWMQEPETVLAENRAELQEGNRPR